MANLEEQVMQLFDSFTTLNIPPVTFGPSYGEGPVRVETWSSGVIIYDVLSEAEVKKGVTILPCPDKFNPERLELALYENTGTLHIDANTPQSHYTLTSGGKVIYNYDGREVEVTGDTAQDVTQFVAEALKGVRNTLDRHYTEQEGSYTTVPSAPPKEISPYVQRIGLLAGWAIILGLAAAIIIKKYGSPKNKSS